MTDKKYFVDLYSKMIEINSVNPSGGGKGEEKRAEFLKKRKESRIPEEGDSGLE